MAIDKLMPNAVRDAKLEGIRQKSAEEATREIVEAAQTVLERHFGKQVAQPVERYFPIEYVTQQQRVRDLILIGLALRMSREEIISTVRTEFPDWIPQEKPGVSYDKIRNIAKTHTVVIDELYVALGTRVTEIYRFADKIQRLRTYNSLAEACSRVVIPRLRAGIDDKGTISIGNLLVKVLDRLEAETQGDMPKRYRPKDGETEESKVSPEDAEKLLLQKYGDQLPSGMAVRITDVKEE